MRKPEWTVRVINWEEERITRNYLPSLWVEQLRYMGLARELAQHENRTVVEIYCREPTKTDTRIWAEQNAARMKSFGIDAVAAPKWGGEPI